MFKRPKKSAAVELTRADCQQGTHTFETMTVKWWDHSSKRPGLVQRTGRACVRCHTFEAEGASTHG